MAYGASKHEEVEYGVHIASLVHSVEGCTGDVAHTLSNNPYKGCCADAVNKWLEGNEYGQSHTDETECFYVTVLLEMLETYYGAGDGTESHEGE